VVDWSADRVDLFRELIALDRAQLHEIRDGELRKARRFGSKFDAERIEFSMAYSEREVIRISEDLEIPGLLRADLERELSAFEMGMRLK
uniref:hypothetical protein n=1 Tax=Stenotrophomonas maltophilia TaxID=40324 RepID=UPI0013DC6BE8